jgi:hypothetical protein
VASEQEIPAAVREAMQSLQGRPDVVSERLRAIADGMGPGNAAALLLAAQAAKHMYTYRYRDLVPYDGTAGHVPAGTMVMWRRKSDGLVWMGYHDYEHVFRIADDDKPLGKVREFQWMPLPGEEFCTNS